MGCLGSNTLRPGAPSSTTFDTRTFDGPLPSVGGTASKTTCFARYAWPSGPATLSALAMLLAVTLRRSLWAAIAELATSKMLNSDMASPLECGQHRLQLGIEELERRFVAHGVVREFRALGIHLHRVAVEARLRG